MQLRQVIRIRVLTKPIYKVKYITSANAKQKS
jgi:hypothetical protein